MLPVEQTSLYRNSFRETELEAALHAHRHMTRLLRASVQDQLMMMVKTRAQQERLVVQRAVVAHVVVHASRRRSTSSFDLVQIPMLHRHPLKKVALSNYMTLPLIIAVHSVKAKVPMTSTLEQSFLLQLQTARLQHQSLPRQHH